MDRVCCEEECSRNALKGGGESSKKVLFDSIFRSPLRIYIN